MGYRMSYLVQRGAVWWFRIRLPKGLAGTPLPRWWPGDRPELIGKEGKFRTELTYSLEAKDYHAAKRRGAREYERCHSLFASAVHLLQHRAAPGVAELEAFRAATRRERLMQDDSERDNPSGVTIIREALPGGGLRQSIHMPDAEHLADDGDGLGPRRDMTDADLLLLQFKAEREQEASRKALAMRQLPRDGGPVDRAAVDNEVTRFLEARGFPADALTSDERRQFHLAAAQGLHEASADILRRNEGAVVPTPAEDAGKPAHGPRLSVACEEWATGIPSRGLRAPRPKTIMEARLAVRWFRELHGDLPVASIRRDHVRKFREAVAKVPGKGLTHKQRDMPLPELLKGLPANAVPRSMGSVAKHLNLLSGVIAFAAKEHDLADHVMGWTNPVAGQKPTSHLQEGDEDSKRKPFTLEDLRAIFSSPAISGKESLIGGRGEAAKFFPLLALFAGMRLDEIGQLLVRDIKLHPECGLWAIDINEDGEGKRLKRARGKPSAAKRMVPVHEELVRCGFLAYHEKRLKAVGPGKSLFDGFAPNSQGKWTADWSKWFGRYLRKEIGIADEQKVFHSFRHSFNDACRDAGIHLEIRKRLIGHSEGGVNAGYGEGAFFAELNEYLQRLMSKGRYVALDLSDLHVRPNKGSA